MEIQTSAFAIPPVSQLGISNPDAAPGGLLKELLMSQVLGRYSTLAKAGKLWIAQANVTAPVIFSTAAGTGGPLLWNRPGSNVDAHILGVAVAGSVAATVAGALGITGNSGQVVAPTATTAIDGKTNAVIGGADGAVEAYRVGTPTNAGGFLHPLFQVHTGALTVDGVAQSFVDVGGQIIVPPGAWAALAASATLTTFQAVMAILWTELPK